jgi:autotransporter-associated beta strand protein
MLPKIAQLLILVAWVLFIPDVNAADDIWNVQTGYWSVGSNWDNGVPTSSTTAYINNGGTVKITTSSVCDILTLGKDSANSGTVQMTGGSFSVNYAYVGNSGTGTFTQPAGTITPYYYLYLGYNAGSSGTYNLSGSGVMKTYYGEYVGYSGSGTFNQTGGTNGSEGGKLILGHNQGSSGIYNLSGTGTLNFSSIVVGSAGTANFNQLGGTVTGYHVNVGGSAGGTYDQSAGSAAFIRSGEGYLYIGGSAGSNGTYNLYGTGRLSADYINIGYAGTGTFNQSGGTVIMSAPTAAHGMMGLYLGNLSGGNGTYNLSGTGQLTSVLEYIGYNSSATALFRQTGGSNKTNYLSIGSGGRYLLTGGTLDTTSGPGGISSLGQIDCTDSTATLRIGNNNIADFGRANLTNVHGMNVSLGATSLLIVPPGFNPSTAFGSFSANSSSIVHTTGTTLVVPVGKGFGGCGSIYDPVSCQGTITGGSAPNTFIGINLYGGLTVSGAGAVNLYGGNLTVNDAASGMTGGSLNTGIHYVGYSGTGTFTQAGGTNRVTHRFILGYNVGDNGTYNLSGSGQLRASSSSYNDYEDVGYFGTGVFNQSGGINTIPDFGSLTLGSNRGSNGTYNLSGGELVVGTGQSSSSNEYVGYLGNGVFNQSGGIHTVANILCIAYWPYESQAGNGTYNLTGGTLAIHSLQTGNGTATFNFGGGTLQATGSFFIRLPMTLTGIGGNAIVDTNGYACTLSSELSGSGGLNKAGAGALTLSGINNYTGDTTISTGILSLTRPNLYDGSSVNVATNAVLNLAYSGTDVVYALTLGGIQQPPGIYNSANSGGYITGTGSFQVLVPEPSTLALLGIGAISFSYGWRRQKREV